MNNNKTHHKYIADITREIPEIPPESIVSKTIHNDENVKITLFGFAPGQELSEHTATHPAILEVIKGEAIITLGHERYATGPGTLIHMPARLEHSLIAETEVVMLLYLLK